MFLSNMKIKYVPFLIVLVISKPVQSSENVKSPTVANFKQLMYEYFLACGSDYFCNAENFNFLPTYETRRTKICPECQCDRECASRNDCCPDVIFSFPLPVCILPAVEESIRSRTYGKYMINTCVNKTDSLLAKCETSDIIFKTDEIDYPPVTSRQHSLSFQNKFCAECNGVFEYEDWSLEISCRAQPDLNFFSSYMEIFNTTESLIPHCDINFRSVESDMKHCKDVEESRYCNRTGTWLKYDKDIATACNSQYILSFGEYLNIFCFMCNPPKLTTVDRIDSCNVTGYWYPQDTNLEYACSFHAQTQITLPYKNVFCFFCNKNNSRENWYYDVSGMVVSEEYIQSSRKDTTNVTYIYTISFEKYNLDVYKDYVGFTTLPEVPENGKSDIISKDSISVNLTSLLMYEYSVTGYHRYCRQLVPYMVGRYNCSCNLDCFFTKSVECCLDLVLEYPVSCLKPEFSSEGPALLMTDGCFQSSWSNNTRSRCEAADGIHDIFFSLPVSSFDGNILYKNFDCFLCNQNEISKDMRFSSSLNYQTWNIYMECDTDLNVKYQTSLYDILATARNINCIVDILSNTRNMDETCEKTESGVPENTSARTCNISGKWKTFDPDIQWACESKQSPLNMYNLKRNVFCDICNPENNSLPPLEVIEECSIEDDHQLYGKDIIKACKDAPAIKSMFPAKNVFCKYCNLNNTIIPRPEATEMVTYDFQLNRPNTRDTSNTPTLQDLFNPFNKILKKPEPGLNRTHIFDPIITRRRRLTCFPGKVISGYRCLPLLKYVKNLKYTMAFSLDGFVNISGDPSTILKDMANKIETEITHQLMVNSVGINSLYILANFSCSDTFTGHGPVGIRYLIHITFLVTEVVERLTIEEKLINMTNTELVLLGEVYVSQPAKRAYSLPVILGYDFSYFCHLSTHDSTRYNPFGMTVGHTSLVTRLLTCRQVELDADEYTLNLDTLEIFIKYDSKAFYQDRYLLMPDGRVRLCLEDYQEILESYLNQSNTNIFRKALEITSSVCTGISLCCLVLTFITYLLFPQMRSVPGVSNMNLVLTMFLSQALFQFGIEETSIPPLCKCIGVFIHYFWLAMFACTSICSFHMYRTFATNTLVSRSKNSRKTVAVYMLFSYGTPALVIALNITVVYMTSSHNDFISIGYGGNLCFISNVTSFYVTFLGPVLIVCVLNVVLFVRVAVQIKRTPDVESTKNCKADFLIYIKLFTVTGTTWLFVVIDTFVFPMSVFSFIVTFLTGCQGLFILSSFVLNKRVVALYKSIFQDPKQKHQNSTVTKSTESKVVVSTTL